jgi:hypothetical protein
LITDSNAAGQTLRLRFDYTVKGGHPADVKRALDRCLADADAELMGKPTINSLSVLV